MREAYVHYCASCEKSEASDKTGKPLEKEAMDSLAFLEKKPESVTWVAAMENIDEQFSAGLQAVS